MFGDQRASCKVLFRARHYETEKAPRGVEEALRVSSRAAEDYCQACFSGLERMMASQPNTANRIGIIRDLEAEQLLQDLVLESCRPSPYFKSPEENKRRNPKESE